VENIGVGISLRIDDDQNIYSSDYTGWWCTTWKRLVWIYQTLR